MSSRILIWEDKCQKWDDIVICQPLMFSPAPPLPWSQQYLRRYILLIDLIDLLSLQEGIYFDIFKL